jgi:hypothetical protein
VLVEMPLTVLESRLRARGHRVHVVDHHLYSPPGAASIDRRHPLSSLEQVVDLLSCRSMMR